MNPSEGQEAAAPPARSPLWRRLPLVLVVVIGLAVVMPAAPHDVEIDYDLGTPHAEARHLEVELRDARGVGVRRSEVNVTPGARTYIQHLRLARGQYRAELTVSGDGGSQRLTRDLTIGDEELVEVAAGGG